MMKRILCIMLLTTLFLQSYAGIANYEVVPLPQSIKLVKGQGFSLTDGTLIVYAGADEAMQRNAQFLAQYFKSMTNKEVSVTNDRRAKNGCIVLALDKKLKGDEAYHISVSNKTIRVTGKTPKGVFYGIQTLRKSLAEEIHQDAIVFPAVEIDDEPRFGYRGMMLDCARHFFPVSFVKKFIDLLALHNMNTFHWHLTDDQGWRIEIKKYPELTKIGSVRQRTVIGRDSDLDDGTPYGGYYTQEEAREIVEYARQRHIKVIPEIDMPGHMMAALATFPELGCTGGPYEVGFGWGIYLDVLCLGNEKIYPFLEDIIDELVPIFPAKEFHIGGDETPRDYWKVCPKCQALAKREGIDTHQLQAYFTKRMEKYLNSKGKIIIGWDEILEGDINPSATIMSWRGVSNGNKASADGHDVIMSPTEFAYFDYYQTDQTRNEPMAWGGCLPVEKVYSFDPAPDSLSAKAKQHIIGAQANLWTEYIPYTQQAEYMLLPRMSAMAEVQWMPVSQKNYQDFVKRLYRLAKVYDHEGYIYALHLWPERYHFNRNRW